MAGSIDEIRLSKEVMKWGFSRALLLPEKTGVKVLAECGIAGSGRSVYAGCVGPNALLADYANMRYSRWRRYWKG
jgi:hypothetical protein